MIERKQTPTNIANFYEASKILGISTNVAACFWGQFCIECGSNPPGKFAGIGI